MTVQIDELLFDPGLIPVSVQESVGNDIEVGAVAMPFRPACVDNAHRSALLLRPTTRVVTLSCSQFLPMLLLCRPKSTKVSHPGKFSTDDSPFRCHEGLRWLLLYDGLC